MTNSIENLERLVADQARRAQQRARVTSLIVPILSIGIIGVLWEMAVRILNVQSYLLPPPSEVIVEFIDEAGAIWSHGIVTMYAIGLGYGLAVVAGVGVAIVLHAAPVLAKGLYPILVGSQAFPKIAIAPILIVWFGFGLIPKVLIAFLMAFFPVAIATLVGLAALAREHLVLARSMDMGPIATFLRIRLPNALPSMFGGLKIAVTLAVVGAIVGEFVGADAGLGYMLLVASGNLNTALLFAGVLTLTGIGIVLFWIVEAIERLALPWYDRQAEQLEGG